MYRHPKNAFQHMKYKTQHKMMNAYKIHHWWLAPDQSRSKARHATIFDVPWWLGSNIQNSIKGKRILIPTSPQQQALSQLYSNHMGTEVLSTVNLIRSCKIMFAEYGLSRKIMSHGGTNLILRKIPRILQKANNPPCGIIVIWSPE